ncbi:MAG: flagellar biosynthetic protein FliO [Desulfosarcina sp.]|nr:flagellar biosynthetic protein FliO [Desulfosarcina sp.]MBC2764994.1 flagellar biosynthetic protein FliO [Desulfosarcina sp.]
MNGAPDMITAGLKMIASLGVVLALILFLLYGIKKLTSQRMGGAGGKQIQVLESHYLGVKKTISLVRVPGKVLVLGISGDRINLLDTLDDEIVQQQMPVGESKSFGPIFTDRLKKIGSGFKGKEDR